MGPMYLSVESLFHSSAEWTFFSPSTEQDRFSPDIYDRDIPGSVQVIRHNVEEVDNLLDLLKVEMLHIPIARRNTE